MTMNERIAANHAAPAEHRVPIECPVDPLSHRPPDGDLASSDVPSQEATRTRPTVLWECRRGHQWRAAATLQTIKDGCPHCSSRLPVPGGRLTRQYRGAFLRNVGGAEIQAHISLDGTTWRGLHRGSFCDISVLSAAARFETDRAFSIPKGAEPDGKGNWTLRREGSRAGTSRGRAALALCRTEIRCTRTEGRSTLSLRVLSVTSVAVGAGVPRGTRRGQRDLPRRQRHPDGRRPRRGSPPPTRRRIPRFHPGPYRPAVARFVPRSFDATVFMRRRRG